MIFGEILTKIKTFFPQNAFEMCVNCRPLFSGFNYLMSYVSAYIEVVCTQLAHHKL